ncbi:FxsB family cyclophane-forming radical SAM/SPASM peptide maturase [Streptomyces sp. NPDC001941]|uniref:FxsB family cyclophane-forming radical SAM/SPASM peptide maturase n=1 Tax=Streptomyces sp. NPDC001941 TaxID=3154659 RepID=UPI00331F73C5
MDRPPPALTQFVVKVASRCDLKCDHCYVYEHADTSWRGRPRFISDKALAQTADRIAEHARTHRLSAVHVVLHGGEPLLYGRDGLRRAATEFSRALDGVCALDLRLHTNGVLLDEEFCELFLELGIKVGVSLDGDRAANDRHRRFADGRTSHPQVLRAVGLLNRPRYRPVFAGILCTIDVANDPEAVYRALVALEPPRLDLLLPHATWDAPPPRPGPSATPYADWLATVHRLWEADGRPVPIRMFDSVLRTLRGQSSLTESLGLSPADLAVIEADGTFEQADTLKITYDGAPVTGMDVFANSLDDVAAHPGVAARARGIEGLAAQCRACPVVTSCGGGLYAHRYRAENGFDNPSVFCPDLLQFVSTVSRRETDRQFDDRLAQLAGGLGDDAVVAWLDARQLDANRRLLAELGALVPGDDPVARDAWELVTDLDETAPDALDTVLAHPYLRRWALAVLDRGERAELVPGLARIAAAACLVARRERTVAVPVTEGTVHLPGLGVLSLPGASGPALLTPTGDGFTVRAGDRVLTIGSGDGLDGLTPYWQPVRVMRMSGWTVALEDTDPWRDCHEWPVAERLSQGEAKRWEDDLREAWEFLRAELPQYAEGVARGLRVVTPLRAPDQRSVSCAAKEAHGAVAAALPGAPDLLALLLVHEYQHVKLGAVLDDFALFDRAETRRFYAPWRDDPRPFEGLLQGTYAHLAVTDFWRAARRTGQRADAEEQFARWREHTAGAVAELAGSGALTPLGERFVAGMAGAVEGWDGESISASVREEARRSAREHRARWLQLHGTENDQRVE